MIRRVSPSKKAMIPSHVRQMAKNLKDSSFRQNELDTPIASIAKMIPFPVERQVHSLIVLGNGVVANHFDELDGVIATCYCIPFHLSKGSRLRQNDQAVVMDKGACYSFNQTDWHGVDHYDQAGTYAAFIVVIVHTPEEFAHQNKLKTTLTMAA